MSRKQFTQARLFAWHVLALLSGTFPLTEIHAQRQDTVSFKKHVITTDFISEGAAVADVDRDGKKDVIAGCYWYKAPEWKPMEIYAPEKFKTTEYSNSFLNFASDVDQDGWVDVVRIGFPGDPATWFRNPGKKTGHWKQHALFHAVGNESPTLTDIDGDGINDLLCADSENKKMVWVKGPVFKKDTAWKRHIISNDSVRGTHRYTHGLGHGDMNGDGRADVIIKEGWWEAPQDRTSENWAFHPATLGADAAQMYVLDVDHDGDPDVISSSAHDFGIWWHEQVKEGNEVTWKQHEISRDFSQTHGLVMTDVNGDGHPDLVTGKRYYAHNGKDPGAHDPAVLYWFEFKPGKEPRWIGHRIDDNSGAGLIFVVEDINKDRKKDIVISNKKGVYIFTRQ